MSLIRLLIADDNAEFRQSTNLMVSLENDIQVVSLARDGQSDYFLNGTRCRRRDITDIFLGTGLGPRSYAIIEQGMISRLIESKPEELRVFLEEAAGISKYRERRKETESRMRRTLENLERLTDLRDELSRQLQHLQRQAQAAEKYTELKAEERDLRAQLLALQCQALDVQIKSATQPLLLKTAWQLPGGFTISVPAG